MNQKIYKSSRDKVFAGVCGGVAEYFNIDPVIVRLIWVLATLAYGAGLIFYIIAAIIMPRDTSETGRVYKEENYDSEKGKMILGAALVGFGILVISKKYFHWVDGEMLVAAAFICIGVFLFLRSRGGNDEK